MNSIYRSAEGRCACHSFYDRCLAEIPRTTESTYVDTRFGQTHVLVLGPEGAPPLVMLHGIHAFAPDILAAHHDLADSFRIYAIDVVGQPGRSAEVRPPKFNSSYSDWLVDVLDGLGIDQAPIMGASYGGYIILQLMKYAPQRISRAALIVPVCVAPFRYRRMVRRVVLPSLAYQARPSKRVLGRVTRSMFAPGEESDPRIAELLANAFSHIKQDPIPPPMARKAELANYHAPTLVLGAEHE
ncbi:MAG: alpha/beta fold hydrolase, partial [Proteobacteria bacterium]|nr:alpha/beta fold hydrolase [Pseudomonadota bacterium]